MGAAAARAVAHGPGRPRPAMEIDVREMLCSSPCRTRGQYVQRLPPLTNLNGPCLCFGGVLPVPPNHCRASEREATPSAVLLWPWPSAPHAPPPPSNSLPPHRRAPSARHPTRSHPPLCLPSNIPTTTGPSVGPPPRPAAQAHPSQLLPGASVSTHASVTGSHPAAGWDDGHRPLGPRGTRDPSPLPP